MSDEPEVVVEAEVNPNGTGPQAEEPQPEAKLPMNVECAFLVYMDKDGHFQAISDRDMPLIVAREANVHDFYHAAADITKDVEAFETSMRVIGMQTQMAQQMMAQQKAQQEAQRIMTNIGDVRGPGGAALLNRQMRRHPPV